MRRATRAKACGRLAEGICSRKVCGSFVADIQLMFQCVHGKARRNDSSRRKGVAECKKRNTYLKSRCQQQAKKAKTAGVFRRRFAEASRKLRGRVALCLQASGHVAWAAQWSPSLHKLRRSTTSLKMTFCANARGSKSSKPCPAEGLRKQTMKHMCRGSSRKGPLGPRQGCGRVRGA